MTTNKLISIVVPIYNAESYLAECVESIINQTYNNWELLLINDGSTDSSFAICEKYEKKDARIRAINKQNGGVSSARNTGIQLATGEYITFIDADDYILPNYCSDMIEKANDDISLVAFGLSRFYENKIVKINHRLSDGIYSFNEVLDIIIDDGTLSGFTLHSSCAILFNLRIIKLNCIKFNENIKYNEDGLFCTEYVIKAKKSVLISFSNSLYMYRANNLSATNTVDVLGEKYNNSMSFVESSLLKYKQEYPMQIENQILRRKLTIELSKMIYLARKKTLSSKMIKGIFTNEDIKKGLKLVDYTKLNKGKKLLCLFIKLKAYFIIKIALERIYGNKKNG